MQLKVYEVLDYFKSYSCIKDLPEWFQNILKKDKKIDGYQWFDNLGMAPGVVKISGRYWAKCIGDNELGIVDDGDFIVFLNNEYYVIDELIFDSFFKRED